MIANRRSTACLTCVVVWLTLGCQSGDDTQATPTTDRARTTEVTSPPPKSTDSLPSRPSVTPVIATEATVGGRVAVPDDDAVRAALEQWAAEVHTFGVAVGIRVQGHADVVAAVGTDDRNPDTAMRTDGRFQIASVTKTFVTAAVLSLVEEGSLRLDQTIEPWFPEIDNADQITISMLLSHRSGLADFANDRPDDYQTLMLADLAHRYTPREAIAQSTSLAARFAPGDGYSYSNTNFQILGEIAADITETPIGELIEQRFSRPLHLDFTSLADESAVEPDEHHGWFTLDPAIGDLENDTFDPTIARDLDILDFPRNAVVTQIGAAGAMRSTIDDLLAWGTALYSGDLLQPETLELLFTPTTQPGEVDDDDTSIRYGLGTMLVCPCDENGPRLVGHDGSLIGGRTVLAANPRTGVVVVIHANVQEIALHDLFTLADRLDRLTRGGM
jgi:D-alanyl-D-alanine carboxypeptidase